MKTFLTTSAGILQNNLYQPHKNANVSTRVGKRKARMIKNSLDFSTGP